MKKAIIIGAGLTGLTTAWNLKKTGWQVTVLERDLRTGGAIRTYREKDFVFESGPNTGMVSHPEVTELFEELGPEIKVEPANEDAKRRLIWKNGRWHDLPSSLKDGISTPLFSWKDKFRLLTEPFRKPGKDPDETLDKLVKRRMGKSFLDYAVDPFILGIYAGDPSLLVTRYALPKLYNLEQNYGSFIKGSFKKHAELMREKKYNPQLYKYHKKATKKMFSMSGGLDNLIKALTGKFTDDEILLGCHSITVCPMEGPYTVKFEQHGEIKNMTSHAVITTTGAHEIPSILPFLRDDEKQKINNLLYARVVQVSVGYNEWRGIPLKAFGGLVPSKEHRDILGILFLSSFLKNRAPKSGALLSVFLGGVRNQDIVDLKDEEIKKLVLPELQRMLMVPDCKPDLMRIFRHNHAIPQYSASTGERLETVNNIQKQFPGLILGGNLRDGIGMADRIRQGFNMASELNELFARKEKHQ
ncbi:protoporphyrinogen oxidase [Anaerophaga thermohalophila]|uniref:protoporphyrinogen oxidase n=1 Tax=Anaerophaga thermohalophila TaxID=177400 RepID=UPI0002F64E93|nr:protoporphyrinogen oxidase [Anaerophaga thermohalophila]